MKKKILVYTLVFIAILVIIVFIFKNNTTFAISLYEYYQKISEENSYVKTLKSENTFDETASNFPYIPEGFAYVEGKVETGYVIEDEQGNQFVWVPCNSENLKKADFVEEVFITYEKCWDDNYEEFLKSALENGGFYISRFETGIEDGKVVSKMGVTTFSDLTKKEMEEQIEESFNYEDCTCELINGYAYDRSLSWILEDTTVEINDTEIEDRTELLILEE